MYEGDEWFLQLKGDMVLHILVDGVPKRVDIREGDMYCNRAYSSPHMHMHMWQSSADVGFGFSLFFF